MLDELLIIVTRVLSSGEWQDTWEFDPNQTVAFVDASCHFEYDTPTNPNDICFVVIRGYGNNDVASAIVNLKQRHFQNRSACLILHPGGGEELNIALGAFRDRIPGNSSDRDRVINSLVAIIPLSCWGAYSIGGGSEDEQINGQVVRSLAFYLRQGNVEEFNRTVSGLLDAFRQSQIAGQGTDAK